MGSMVCLSVHRTCGPRIRHRRETQPCANPAWRATMRHSGITQPRDTVLLRAWRRSPEAQASRGPATKTDVALSVDSRSSLDVEKTQALPSRYQLLIATSLSFVLCNMDKVNMSVAIIPMALDFGWSPSISGIVQASFFYGYLLCQLPGGYWASTVGGRKVLPAGVALWSGMTCAVPLLAATIPGLCVARAGVGLGEAVAPSAATDMIARVVPPEERSRAVSFVFGGLHVGSIVGLLAAPVLIHAMGWPSVFIAFGAAGLLWVVWFEALLNNLRINDPAFYASLQPTSNTTGFALQSGHFDTGPLTLAGDDRPDAAWYARTPAPERGGDRRAAQAIAIAAPNHLANNHQGSSGGHAEPADPSLPIPYRAFLRSGPVQALCFTHFCHNWFHYTMLAWLPTYFTSTLSVDLMHAAQTALLPPLAGIAASAMAGPLADGLIAKGVSLGVVRKGVQGFSFLGPFICLLLASSEWAEGDRTATVALITAALGMSSFSLAGMYCTHQDMSPRYASALLGLTNTVGAIPGIIGVATVGYLYDATHSWQDALFMPSALCMLAGAYAYCVHASNLPQNFDQMDNSPFTFEKYLPRLPSWVRLPWAPRN